MKYFKVLGDNTSELRKLNDKVLETFSQAPKIGATEDEHATSMLLLHYSENDSIESFHYDSVFSWTSILSNKPCIIEKIIGKFSLKYKAIYVLNAYSGNGYNIIITEPGYGNEALIPARLNNGCFLKVDIKYNDKKRIYESL